MIDVHSHLCPERLPTSASPAPLRWPCMQRRQGGSTLMIGNKPFRDLDDRSWSAARRIEDMDRDGIALQVLSPMPELLSYWFSVADAKIVCDAVNHEIATVVAKFLGRFAGLGMVPLQDPTAAAKELLHLRSRFGLCGVEIGSQINDVLLGDSRFDVFFGAAEDLEMSIFVHALHPLSTRQMNEDPLNAPLVGFPLDVAMTAVSILKAGVLERFPRLRIAFSHGGGALGSIIGRLDRGWLMTGGATQGRIRPSDVCRKMFFDSNVYDPPFLAHLARSLAPGNFFLGTDYPYPIMQMSPKTYLDTCPVSDIERSSLRRGAAVRFLGLDEAGAVNT